MPGDEDIDGKPTSSGSAPRWAGVGAALALTLLLVLAYWNSANLLVLHDHPLHGWIFWPAVGLLVAMSVSLVIPRERRDRSTAGLVVAAISAILCASAGLNVAI